MILSGHCHVDDARNFLVRAFLETDCETLVFIDDDMVWEPEDLDRLLSHKKDVVGGVVRLKSDTEQYNCRHIDGEIWAKDGLIRVEGVGTAFMKISRHALEQLAKRSESFQDEDYDKTRTPIIFERTMEGGLRFGGDYAFCRKWGEVYIDPSLRLRHRGENEWSGSYGSYLRRINDLPMPGIEAIKQGDFGGNIMMSLYDDWDNDYAANPPLLAACCLMAKESKGPILETGSGLSSLCMAAANPDVQVTSLEQSREVAEDMNAKAAEYELDNLNVIYSPVVNGFYENVPDENWGLVLSDGPSRDVGDRLKVFEYVNGATVIVDDYDGSLNDNYRIHKFERFAIWQPI